MWTLPGLANHVLNDTALLVGGPPPSTGPVDGFASFHKAPSGDFDRGKSNVLFFDGSCEWHGPEESIKLAWPKDAY